MAFDGHEVHRLLRYLNMERSGVYAISDPDALFSRIDQSVRLLKSQSPFKGIDGSGLVYQFLLDCMKYIEMNTFIDQHPHGDRLKPALDMIERNIGRVLALEELAASINVTPQYFCELFKNVMRQRPSEYINQRKTIRAKEILIAEPGKKIADVARMVGFENECYFSRVFRKLHGISPRGFRQVRVPSKGA